MNKLAERYIITGTQSDLTTNEYLPAFKLMIGGSDYHLFNPGNLAIEQPQSVKKRHLLLKKI
jgi:hypothetical protein